MLKKIAVAAFLALAPLAAAAQTLGVFASFSQTGQTSMTATTTSSRTPFASTAPVAWVCNFGSVTAYVGTRNAGNLGTPVTVANGFPIPASLCVSLTATGFSNLAAITASGSTSLSISTGTGWPSAAASGSSVTISGTVPVSGTFWPYALGQTTMSASVPVAIASNQSAIPVTGTFFQATQPVSGTFWQATQPISAVSLPLPALAATSTLQSSMITAIGTPMQQTGGTVTANAGTNLNTSALALESGGNLASIATNTGRIPSQGQATMAASTPVAIASNQSAVPISASALPLPALAATSTKQSDGTQKTQVVDGSGNVIGATANAIDVNIKSGNPTSIGLAAATTGGCTPYHLSGGTAASTNSTAIKAAAAGTLCDLTLINTTATIYYLKLYDSAGAPTCSSATGLKHVYPIPASATSSGAGIQRTMTFGEAYTSGIGFCVTGGGGDTDNTNAATGVYIEASYK
jgi:hypothetical protein